MTTKQRKALQQVVLEAGELMLPNNRWAEAYTFSCSALDRAFMYYGSRYGDFGLSWAYWEGLFGRSRDESVGEVADVDNLGPEAREIRLLMLALLHTLIGSGDFEAITGYSPDLS
jgi:hypothetical protein